ncbi:hypothetical protein LCGC14_1342140 [marine sediment metagenome]|uniref:Uncharacterized protein n=1 Tax=marine sediment metagenome TaxID=412755 RepID=A0A0F9MU68_9ZZZZ
MIRKTKQKYCPKCEEWKNLEQFHKNKSIKDGHSFYCKKCSLELHKVSYDKKRKPIRFLNRKHSPTGWNCSHCGIFKTPDLYHKNGTYADGTQKHQSWCAKCMNEVGYKSRIKNGTVLLNKEQYNCLFIQQAGKCAICGTH